MEDNIDNSNLGDIKEDNSKNLRQNIGMTFLQKVSFISVIL